MATRRGGGLYTSIYGKQDVGLFNELYSNQGATAAYKRMDSRLGEEPQTADIIGIDLFSKNTFGVPNWILSLFVLGIILSYKKEKRRNTAK